MGFSTLLQFRRFQKEVLKAMENKVKLDEEYIQVIEFKIKWSADSGQQKVGVYSFSRRMVLCIHTNWLV